MDPNEVAGTVVSTHNLVDLQNYLVTFNKMIGGSDTSSMPVIPDADGSDSVNDILASVSGAQSLQSGADAAGASHFSTAFYSEQSLLDSGLGEDSQNIHSLVTGEDGVDSDLVAQIKQESAGIDLDDANMAEVQAQLVNLTSSISDLTGSSQELIMTSVNDGLDANEGKVIRIVSLTQDGSILSLSGEGGHMQILGDDGLHVGGDGKDLPVTLESLGQPLVMPSSSHDLLDTASSTTSATITNSATDLLVPDSLSDDANDQSMEMDVQSQLISVQPSLEGISAEGLQALTLGCDAGAAGANPVILNATNTLQTLAILPSEGQNGEMNYVLIVTQPDGTNKELSAQGISLDMNSMLGLKEEASELTEEYIEEDGTVKRILKITPKKIFPNLGNLTCTYCNYTSPKRYLLSRHMKSHSEDRPHKCEICSRGFKTLASLTNHVNTHTGTRPHKCKECDAAFTTSGELVRHVRYRHTFEKPHKCPECDYASVELSKLKRHMRSHTGERPYQCTTCSYASPDTYKLKRHMRIHTGEKPYVCDICNARFTQSNSLKAHKLIHSGNKPVFQCPYCPTTCGRKTDLKIHTQKLHNSEEPVTCRKCGENFPDRYHFKLHWKTHEGEKCFKCEECDYAACSQRHLESHILTHSGEKPFECDECDHAFRQKQLLRRHKNHHHTSDYHPPTPRDKNHDCAACEKSYANKGNLMRHMAQHGDLSEDDTTSAASGEGEGGLRTITADHILHGDLMQEWREGKLGNAPQVVIVHPDGRIEEVTPKLQIPPDRSVDELLPVVGEQEKSSKERGTEPPGSQKKTVAIPGSSKSQKRIIVTVPGHQEMDEDGNKEAGTQVELVSDMSDDDNEEEEEEPNPGDAGEHFLHKLAATTNTNKSGEGDSMAKVLEGSAVALDAATSADLESMIASLPVVATPITFDQSSSTSQDQHQIPTIDAPEILAHLDFTTKLIKQEKPDGSDTEGITVSYLQDSASSSMLQSLSSSSQLKVVVTAAAGGKQVSQPPEVVLVSTGGKAAATESTSALMSVPKTVTVVVGSGVDGREKKTTRSMKRKEEEEQASPAKRTRKAIAEQAYTYI